MPELRKDLIRGEWVIIASERAKRPDMFKGQPQVRPPVSDTRTCPFCEGNESMTPREIYAVSEDPDRKPNAKGWKIRVVPNKFPALIPDLPLKAGKEGIYDTMSGFGVHEVIIASPGHVTDINCLSLEQLEALILAYRERIKALGRDGRIKSVILMHNQGREAGASLDHAHSQLFGLPLVPPIMEKELSETLGYFNRCGRCAMCDLLEFESKEGTRVVCENEHFLVLQPFASGSPFETWIVPRRHSSGFDKLSDEQAGYFARSLKLILDFLYHELDNPAFNYYIHSSAPIPGTERHFHWHLELFPKLTIKAGFEMGTGVDINITAPEPTAEYIRKNINTQRAGI